MGPARKASALLRGDLLPRLLTTIPGPESKRLARRLKRLESPDATFYSARFPVFWAEARGANVLDADGNRYVDTAAGFGVAAIGHAHPAIRATLHREGSRLIHAMGDVHPNLWKERLAEALLDRIPWPGRWKVIFGTSGADAVEAAVKTAVLATGRPRLLTFEGGYHGLTLGTVTLTGWERFRTGLRDLLGPKPIRAPFPRDEDNAAKSLEIISSKLNDNNDSRRPIAAVLIEPIQGRAGIILPPAGFLRRLQELCDRHGTLLILDEVYTGLGRTGRWWAAEAEAIIPDLMTVGKGLGGGLPISACIGRAEVIDAWGPSSGEARHTQTFSGHPLACACACRTLEVIEKEGLPERAARLGAQATEWLRQALGHLAIVRQIRGQGLMLGVEFNGAESGRSADSQAARVVIELLRRGIISLAAGPAGNVISLTPPLTIAEAQLSCAIDVLADVVRSADRLKRVSSYRLVGKLPHRGRRPRLQS